MVGVSNTGWYSFSFRYCCYNCVNRKTETGELIFTYTVRVCIWNLFNVNEMYNFVFCIVYAYQILSVDEDFITARDSQAWYSIGLSLFAGGMGTWTLTAPPETAAIGGWYD